MVTVRIRGWRATRAGTGPTAPPRADSDARRRTDDPRRLVGDPEALRRHRLRRRVARSAMLAIFIAGSIGAVVGDRGWLEVRRLQHETAALERAVEAERVRLAAERAAIDRLRDEPLSRERIARERLGLLDEGEVDFLLPRAGDGD